MFKVYLFAFCDNSYNCDSLYNGRKRAFQICIRNQEVSGAYLSERSGKLFVRVSNINHTGHLDIYLVTHYVSHIDCFLLYPLHPKTGKKSTLLLHSYAAV